MDDEDLINSMKKNWYHIIWNSAILFGLFPIIKWFFWFLVYFSLKNEWALNKFTESTFDKIIPWYLGILVNFKESLAIFIVCFLIVWFIYGILESCKE